MWHIIRILIRIIQVNEINGEISQSLSQFVEILFHFHSKTIESTA